MTALHNSQNQNIKSKIEIKMPEYDFHFRVPLGSELIKLDDEWAEKPRPDYDYYNYFSYLNTHTLMAMLFDKHCGQNSTFHKSNKDTFKVTYEKVEHFLEQAIKVNELEILNYQDLMISWGGTIPFCCVELSIKDISKWLSKKSIVEKIESVDIEVSGKFKELIQIHTSNQESPSLKPELIDGKPQQENNTTGKYIFRKNSTGKIWEIAFKEGIKPIKHYLGLQYIQELLRQPNVKISAIALKNTINFDSEFQPETKIFMDDLSDTMISNNDCESYKKTLKDISIKKNELSQNDHKYKDDLSALEKEEDGILKILNESTFKGKPKPFSGSGKKAMNSVCENISYAMKNIKETYPDLHAHLESHVKKGYDCSYTPTPNNIPDWIFD